MSILFRRAQADDLPHCGHLLTCDRPMLSPENWQRFPALLGDLLARERISLVLIEEPATRRYRMCGGSAFVDPVFLAAALDHPALSILDQALTVEATGGSAFLPPRRIASENGRGDLRLLNFLGVPDFTGLEGPDGNLMFATINEAWRFHHYGYQLSEFYSESTNDQMADFMRGMQCSLVRERQMPGGEVARAFRFTRADALSKTGGNISFVFIAPLPRFAFSFPEQRLIEMALMDYSDREIANRLDVTADAVKKRWRSIYNRVRDVEARLVPTEASGADQRRQLLQYMRQHLEEIRPYQAGRETTPAG